ncbi:hypothetical protein P3T76_000963 [Phytophthora citrophthora]|uniref:Uncharacterized protein n=1 Tax=Phytophthora citrophthora TaxID=4793 RepID=A0AAD9GZJ3_9STRA|nr:hypothetical protein P3T76_000963 [Phytophthora citrophthora]
MRSEFIDTLHSDEGHILSITDCPMGGPHLYYTQRNDAYRTIPLERFNIALKSVLTSWELTNLRPT